MSEEATCDVCGSRDAHPTATCKQPTIDLMKRLAASLKSDAAIREDAPRSCNRHKDCDAADRKARETGRTYADHCHDSCCEDCFGN